MTFHDLLRELQDGKTFEKICQEQGKTLVECDGNMVYLDTDLEEFLEELDAALTKIFESWIEITTKDGSIFEIPYENISNRFDNNLSNEIILNFEREEILRAIGVSSDFDEEIFKFIPKE